MVPGVRAFFPHLYDSLPNTSCFQFQISCKDLLGWDFVLQLMGEGLLTDASLEALVQECGANAKGRLKLENFSVLIDHLVDLYGNANEEDEDEESDDDEKFNGPDREIGSKETILGETDEEYFDIDIEDEFNKLAEGGRVRGRKYFTFSDLKKWDVISQMSIDDSDLKDVCRAAGVKNIDKIGSHDFERICDVLFAEDT